MAEIRSKLFEYGNKKEGSWPPRMPKKKSGGVYHIDKKTGKAKKGYPEQEIKQYGKAPFVIGDTIEPYYHPGACIMTDSRSKLKQFDDACGTVTTDKKLPPDPYKQKQAKREMEQDIKTATRKAIAAIDAGTAPMPESVRVKCERQNEIVSKALNFDAFNVAGRKENAKGKKYRR